MLIDIDSYAILITARESVGHLASHEIYRLTKFEIVPLRLGRGNTIQDPDEAGFIELITHHFNSNNFYFSYTHDLTSSLQRNALKPQQNTPFFQTADDRFYWNKFLQTPLIDFRNQSATNAPVDAFILPVMFGFVRIQHTFANHKALTVALISRRSRFRVGTRYFSRGIDEAGNVSNFNETEQLILVPGSTNQMWMSYVQTRGSVPAYWAEVNDLRYKPKLRVPSKIDKSVCPPYRRVIVRWLTYTFQIEPAQKHLQQQVEVYGCNILVNLVDQTGREKPVKLAFEELIRNLGMEKVKYVYFDFHAECSKMRWGRISLLIDHLQDNLIAQGYLFPQVEMLIVTDGRRFMAMNS